MMYDLLTMRKTGANWAKCLPEYARALNQEVKEGLTWKSVFEVYYGRKPFKFHVTSSRTRIAFVTPLRTQLALELL